jgi:hypothetical protein
MNLAGYVPLRRSVFEHTANGKLSSNECLVFLLLVALADRRTGCGTINAPSLRAFLPELSHDSAKRVLCSLESKGYVFRDIVPFSKRVYRFWINKYRPTEGKYKSLQTNISKALESRDVNDIEYINPAPETAPEGAPETAPEGALYYKKREERKEKRENPSIEEAVCASASDSKCASASDSVQRTKRSTLGSACALHDATHDAQQCALQCAPHDATHSMQQTMHHDMQQTTQQDTTHSMQHVHDTSPKDVGLKWSGYEGAYVEIKSGRVLSFQEAERLLGKEGRTQ